MWGQANLDSLSADNIGIIPTRVGTSYRNHITDAIGQDHPHACGDKIKHGEMQELFAG